MMCGGLVVLNPGSPTQVVCAILIMQSHLLLVLKIAPYVRDSEDWSSFASSLGLTLTYVGALIKMLQVEVRKSSEEHANELNYADTAMDVLPIACVSIVISIMVFADCGLWKLFFVKTDKKNRDKKNRDKTQVQPTQPVDVAEKGTNNDNLKKDSGNKVNGSAVQNKRQQTESEKNEVKHFA